MLAGAQEVRKRLVGEHKRLRARVLSVTEAIKTDRDQMCSTRGEDIEIDGVKATAPELRNRDLLALKEIGSAIAMVDNGTYGVCIDCEEEIPAARLKAILNATRCVRCQKSWERTGSRPETPEPSDETDTDDDE